MTDRELRQNMFIPLNTVCSRQRLAQNYVLIWIDTSIDQSEKDYQCTLAQLQNIVNDINIFTEIDKCLNFLTEMRDMKVFLITDDIFGPQIASLTLDSSQLDAVWILCKNKSQHKEWISNWPKIKGVHTEIEAICEGLQLAVKQCNDDSIAMSFVLVDEEISNKNLNQLEPSFMYTQIFKEIFLGMKYDTQAMKNLVAYWRELYRDNANRQKIIDQFEHDYRPEMSILWYTRECFIYEILNRALRDLDGDILINMGFFIHNLHRQIKRLYKEQISSYNGKSFVIFRGQGLSRATYENLKKTIGGLLSFNNFLSTSKNRDVSLLFAESASTRTETVGILFQITVDPSITSSPFADIQSVSYYETEKEILFSMHTVFRIKEIKSIDESSLLYPVDLEMTRDDDQQLRTLTDRIRQEIDEYTGWERMGSLLIKIGQFDKAEELYKMLLEQASEQDIKAHYYNQLGYVKDDQGDYDKAIQYYEEGLNIKLIILSPDDPLLAISYNNIGATYRNMARYSEALSFYEKALHIRERVLPFNDPDIAQSYNNIGAVYSDTNEFLEALSFYEKALEIRKIVLPSNHPDIAQSYNNIGLTYDTMGKHSDALLFYEKAREIFENTLPPNHPFLATSYNNIGMVYMYMGEYSKALSFHEKALKIREQVLPFDHPDMAQSFNNIAKVYNNKQEYSDALSFYKKAREIFEKTLSPNHPLLAKCYNNMSEVHRNMEQYSTALLFSKKAIEILDNAALPNESSLAAPYENIGLVYYKIDQYSEALFYLNRSHEILQRSFPADHPKLQNVRKTIDVITEKARNTIP